MTVLLSGLLLSYCLLSAALRTVRSAERKKERKGEEMGKRKTRVQRVLTRLADKIHPERLDAEACPTIDLSEWSQLGGGVYIHRWQPRLMIVRAEMPEPYCQPDVLTEEEWIALRECLVRNLSWESVDPMLSALAYTDVRIIERCHYVV